MRAKTTRCRIWNWGTSAPQRSTRSRPASMTRRDCRAGLAAAAAGRRRISEADVVEICRGRRQGGGPKEIKEADQKAEAEAEAARLLALGAWEAACEASSEAERAALEALLEAQQVEAERAVERERAEAEAILDGGPDPELPQTPEPVAASPEALPRHDVRGRNR